MMASLTGGEKLQILGDRGLRVHPTGPVTDWEDRPAQDAKPIGQELGVRLSRRAFTPDEDETIRSWCEAAEQEGISGNRVFEQLEVVLPHHSWQAYQNRWRKKLRSIPVPAFATDEAFPNLDRAQSEPVVADGDYRPIVETLPTAALQEARHEETAEQRDHHNEREANTPDPRQKDLEAAADPESGEDADTYSNQRVEVDQVLFRKLGVVNESGLHQLLRQPWILTIYQELLASKGTADFSLLRQTTSEPPLDSRSPHKWKLERAVFFLSKPTGLSSRYGVEHPDTSSWSEDDHDIRFIVRAVNLGSAWGEAWHNESKTGGWRAVCEKALWLLLWFKWLHKPTRGSGKEMIRLQKKREKWLKTINKLLTAREECRSVSPSHAEVDGGSSHRMRHEDINRQLYLLSDSARGLYLQNRDARLASWGVGSDHSKTCILAPAAWALINPQTLVDASESWPVDEPSQRRLTIAIGGHTIPWARAAAWFETWPRTTTELQHFLPPSQFRDEPSRMHGSHRCLHGLCIVPMHMLYEDKDTNLSRNSCARDAIVLRTYGAPIPQYCKKHDPPCLLQLAALTAYEAFAVQFGIVSIAKDLPQKSPLPRPSHHPSSYQTFHQGPGPSAGFPDIGVEPHDITRLPITTVSPTHGLQWTCSLCNNLKKYKRIVSFWAHLRVQHDVTREQTLKEVTRSAQSYQAWADQYFYDYARTNPVTWQKVLQAQARDFDWDVFAGWRLTRARIMRGRPQSDTDAQDTTGDEQSLAGDSEEGSSF